MQRVVIGIGSNLGERFDNVTRAVVSLRRIAGLQVKEVSSSWRTVPVGGPPQPDYCNAAVLGVTDLPPAALLDALLAIERSAGRVRGQEKDAPRTLDLDLLWIEGVAVDTPGLVVPHPRLPERAFALVPLLEVAADAFDPTTGEPYAATLARLGRGGIAPWQASGEPPLSGGVADS